MIKQSMKVQDFEVWVHLGCTRDEQEFTQPVHFTVAIDFHQSLKAVNSDDLKDTVDYVVITNLIKQVAHQKFYHLVEHLCYDVTLKLADFLKEKHIQGNLAVHMRKIRVPVENLRNGVVFTCETNL